MAVVPSGAVWVGAHLVEDDLVRDAVAAALASAASHRVVVLADREVPTWLLLRVTQACADGGADDVAVAATRETVR